MNIYILIGGQAKFIWGGLFQKWEWGVIIFEVFSKKNVVTKMNALKSKFFPEACQKNIVAGGGFPSTP